jgi:uncharacterized protein
MEINCIWRSHIKYKFSEYKMVKVLLDTNFLLTMVRYKIHAINEIKKNIPAEFYTLSGVSAEMKKLSDNKKIKKEMNIVKQILEKNDVKGIESKMKNVDDELVSLSKEYIIATNDKELRKRIREKGGKSIYLKKLTTVDVSEITN